MQVQPSLVALNNDLNVAGENLRLPLTGWTAALPSCQQTPRLPGRCERSLSSCSGLHFSLLKSRPSTSLTGPSTSCLINGKSSSSKLDMPPAVVVSEGSKVSLFKCDNSGDSLTVLLLFAFWLVCLFLKGCCEMNDRKNWIVSKKFQSQALLLSETNLIDKSRAYEDKSGDHYIRSL